MKKIVYRLILILILVLLGGLPASMAIVKGDNGSQSVTVTGRTRISGDTVTVSARPFISYGERWSPSVELNFRGEELEVGVNPTGELQEPLALTDADGLFTFEVAHYTKVLTSEGRLPKEIEVRRIAQPPSPPANSEIVGDVYQILPSGIIFDPPATLVLGFDPARLPENISSLTIAYYTPEEGWVEMESESGSVAGLGTMTSRVAHLTMFTILAKFSAALAANDLLIIPTEVDTGETVNIIVLVTNTDGQSGSYEVILKINGVVEESKEVTLAAGGSKLISFSTIKDTAGTYSLEVDDLISSFTVKERTVAPPTGAPPTEAPPTEAPPINWLLIGGIIAGVVIVMGLLISVIRRRAY